MSFSGKSQVRPPFSRQMHGLEICNANFQKRLLILCTNQGVSRLPNSIQKCYVYARILSLAVMQIKGHIKSSENLFLNLSYVLLQHV